MKRRQFLASLPASIALAGCLGQSSDSPKNPSSTDSTPTTEASDEPTTRPTTTQTTRDADAELSFGEWYSNDQIPRALRIDGVRFKKTYQYDGTEYNVPDGQRIAIVEFTQKNLSQHEIKADPMRTISLWTQDQTTPIAGLINDSSLPKPYVFPELPTPEIGEKLKSGETKRTVLGALVPADSSADSLPVGYYGHGGTCLAVWRPS